MNHIRFLERAQIEFEDSSGWHEKQSAGPGDRFIDVIHKKKLDLVVQNPELFPKKTKNYREAVLATFPFSIIFRFDKKNNLVTIVSVFHKSRNPKHKYNQNRKK
jgi:plasmid stabilization system protein ParE